VRFGHHALTAMLGADSTQNASERDLPSDEKGKPQWNLDAECSIAAIN